MGKTCLTNCFTSKAHNHYYYFSELEYDPTVTDEYSSIFTYKDESYKINILDTGGAEAF